MFSFLVASHLFGLRDSLTGMSVGCFRDLSTCLCMCACLPKWGVYDSRLHVAVCACFLRASAFFTFFHRQSARCVILASRGGVRSQSAWRVCSVNLALSLRGLGLGLG